jgi:hypothetical protein
MLEKREDFLTEKVAQEREKAKQSIGSDKKRNSFPCQL